MRVLFLTDDRLGPAMAGSALRAWELANALAGAGHEVRLTADRGSSKPHDSPVELVDAPDWRWAQAVVAPPWSLHLPAFSGRHLLVIDGATPLLAELEAMPSTPEIRRRRRTAAARLPVVAARAPEAAPIAKRNIERTNLLALSLVGNSPATWSMK